MWILIYMQTSRTWWENAWNVLTSSLLQPKTESWSKQKDKKDRKQKRQEVKEYKRKRKLAVDEGDLADLASDARLLKKLKKGKVSSYRLKLPWKVMGWLFELTFIVKKWQRWQSWCRALFETPCGKYKPLLHMSDDPSFNGWSLI